jgi:methylthioribose-1-phosphate isomerase
MTDLIKPLEWKNDCLRLLDQRKLPNVEEIVECSSLEDAFNSIRDMVVRGAPLIGYTGIFGMALYAKEENLTMDSISEAADYLNSARPTAVNLEFELKRCVEMANECFKSHGNFDSLKDLFVKFGHEQLEQIYVDNMAMAEIARKELEKKLGKKSFRIMTLCNTGYLACGPMGTALGVISNLALKDQIEHVYASETRPYMQGVRLTSYELHKQNITHEVVVEGSFSYLMKNKLIDAIFIGADRIVKNGDTANKIGSSTLSIVAKHYGVPFYVVAPISSFDFNANDGSEIPIEMRSEDEILKFRGEQVAPVGARALNPSFDVTDHTLIEGIICEKGIISPVSTQELLKVTGA